MLQAAPQVRQDRARMPQVPEEGHLLLRPGPQVSLQQPHGREPQDARRSDVEPRIKAKRISECISEQHQFQSTREKLSLG